jgi:hypothetical protein
MKKVSAKMFFPLAAVAFAAPFFAFAVFVGLRAVELATDARQNLLLLTLAVVAATSGALNARVARKAEEARPARSQGVGARGTSVLHHGL